MERLISLNGTWTLYYYDAVNGQHYAADELVRCNVAHVPAQVPGNVELDLARAGILPEDLFRGMNICKTEDYEQYEWWYCTEFDTPVLKNGEKAVLRFEGVDCLAEYYVNGQKAAATENAFITHEFEVTSLLNKDGKNTLQVHLASALIKQMNQNYDAYIAYGWGLEGGLHLRKPAHSFGWDIFPRAVTAGLWKDVTLVVQDAYAIDESGYRLSHNNIEDPHLVFHFSVKAPMQELIDGSLQVRIYGACGEDSSFEAVRTLRRSKVGKVSSVKVNNPKLWWPYGYGDANIYDTVIQLCRGDEVLAERKMNVGIRKLELRRTELLTDENPSFQFVINNVDIMCRGSNWVPLDAFHSRDKERYAKAMELVSDIGCNMLRVWGGGVYEQDCFYDYCDRHGIMIWHDFMMACKICPMDETFMKNVEQEFTWVIRTLRHHPSIVLWAGDNEIDESMASNGIDPAINSITRKLLPRLVELHDIQRPYLPSSPYISSRAFDEYRKGGDVFVERHLWGARDYYKASFYANSKACFVSETGYHGCPSPESVHKIVDDDAAWPYSNEQWTLHSSDQNNSDHRVRLMADQVRQLFAFDPATLEEFSVASQISQAEAKKFFVERIRVGRPQKSGVLWWNLLDGWPQMSDAVVDYYYDKKLAYDYIKRAQAPFALMMREMANWCYTLVAANDTLEQKQGTYRITDIETGEVFAEGAFTAKANASTDVCRVRMMYSEQRMLLIEWNVDGKVSYNHYLAGMPAFKFEKYVKWMRKLQEICATAE